MLKVLGNLQVILRWLPVILTIESAAQLVRSGAIGQTQDLGSLTVPTGGNRDVVLEASPAGGIQIRRKD